MAELAAVGKRIPKLDAVEKATGRSQYIQDLKLPGMLYGKILYSKYPHARIVNIDVSRAKKLQGVRAVLTGEDIPELRMGVYKDNPPLKSRKVRSYRDEVAAVAATDPVIAEEALDLIEVAEKAANCCISMLDQQPEEGKFYYKMTRDGKLVTEDGPDNYIDVGKPKQAYWEASLPMMLMCRMYQITGEQS